MGDTKDDILTEGEGRSRISLLYRKMGNDRIVLIFNENAHAGAVAIGEYDHGHRRSSVSVITRLGHKDDAIAREAAYLISKHLKTTACVIAGVHLDDITGAEINKILENSRCAVKKYIGAESGAGPPG